MLERSSRPTSRPDHDPDHSRYRDPKALVRRGILGSFVYAGLGLAVCLDMAAMPAAGAGTTADDWPRYGHDAALTGRSSIRGDIDRPLGIDVSMPIAARPFPPARDDRPVGQYAARTHAFRRGPTNRRSRSDHPLDAPGGSCWVRTLPRERPCLPGPPMATACGRSIRKLVKCSGLFRLPSRRGRRSRPPTSTAKAAIISTFGRSVAGLESGTVKSTSISGSNNTQR